MREAYALCHDARTHKCSSVNPGSLTQLRRATFFRQLVIIHTQSGLAVMYLAVTSGKENE